MLKKIWNWIKLNAKLVITIIGFIIFFILLFVFRARSRRIRHLEGELYTTRAKIKLEKIAAKYNVKLVELKKLKEKDKKIEKEITDIEKSLEEKLKDDMTAEEIAEKFRELGLR